jgi:hypothetical protein
MVLCIEPYDSNHPKAPDFPGLVYQADEWKDYLTPIKLG